MSVCMYLDIPIIYSSCETVLCCTVLYCACSILTFRPLCWAGRLLRKCWGRREGPCPSSSTSAIRPAKGSSLVLAGPRWSRFSPGIQAESGSQQRLAKERIGTGCPGRARPWPSHALLIAISFSLPLSRSGARRGWSLVLSKTDAPSRRNGLAWGTGSSEPQYPVAQRCTPRFSVTACWLARGWPDRADARILLPLYCC